jgi:hypothetical protein
MEDHIILCYYNKEPSHVGLSITMPFRLLDLLSEILQSCHEDGIHICAYNLSSSVGRFEYSKRIVSCSLPGIKSTRFIPKVFYIFPYHRLSP